MWKGQPVLTTHNYAEDWVCAKSIPICSKVSFGSVTSPEQKKSMDLKSIDYYSVGRICVGTVHVHGEKNLMALEWDHPKFVTLWLEKVKLEENIRKKNCIFKLRKKNSVSLNLSFSLPQTNTSLKRCLSPSH